MENSQSNVDMCSGECKPISVVLARYSRLYLCEEMQGDSFPLRSSSNTHRASLAIAAFIKVLGLSTNELKIITGTLSLIMSLKSFELGMNNTEAISRPLKPLVGGHS